MDNLPKSPKVIQFEDGVKDLKNISGNIKIKCKYNKKVINNLESECSIISPLNNLNNLNNLKQSKNFKLKKVGKKLSNSDSIISIAKNNEIENVIHLNKKNNRKSSLPSLDFTKNSNTKSSNITKKRRSSFSLSPKNKSSFTLSPKNKSSSSLSPKNKPKFNLSPKSKSSLSFKSKLNLSPKNKSSSSLSPKNKLNLNTIKLNLDTIKLNSAEPEDIMTPRNHYEKSNINFPKIVSPKSHIKINKEVDNNTIHNLRYYLERQKQFYEFDFHLIIPNQKYDTEKIIDYKIILDYMLRTNDIYENNINNLYDILSYKNKLSKSEFNYYKEKLNTIINELIINNQNIKVAKKYLINYYKQFNN